MKKLYLSLCIFISISFLAFSQDLSVQAANKKTAQRCLTLAENYILNESYQSALSQAELGLSYDDSISDLYYIKASTMNKLNKKRFEVLDTVKIAIEKDNWINNNKNNARVLYADLLSDTCRAQESLDVLNQSPLIYSADAEFIRIKDYYRLGTLDAINQARSKIETARRVYPKDERFPYLFFMFETLFMKDAERKGLEYDIPAKVQKTADEYIMRLPDYKTNKIDIEIMASMFASGETQKRLLKATGEKMNNNPMYALAALKAGVISEEKAMNIFFKDVDDISYSCDLMTLEAFVPLITDPALKDTLRNHLTAFNGKLNIDDNLDLIYELDVYYERGRAARIVYDVNNDQINELTSICDFGTPLSIYFENENVSLDYDIYPYVSKVVEERDNTSIEYSFTGNDFIYSPFEMLYDYVFDCLDVEFYIPYVNEEYAVPEHSIMMLNTSVLKVRNTERENSMAVYHLEAGLPFSIQFLDLSSGEPREYAWCTPARQTSFVRYVDYDGDNILETSEHFSSDLYNQYQGEEDQEVIKKIFGYNFFTEPFYLSMIEIDRNNDGIKEFAESYLENDGKVSYWDNDGNGIWDYEFYRYPRKNNEPLKEETIFFNDKGMEYVSVTDIDGVPSTVKVNSVEQKVLKGSYADVYWISAASAKGIEKTILDMTISKLNIGVVTLIDLKSEGRYSVIKIGKNIFIRKLPASDTELRIMEKEINND